MELKRCACNPILTSNPDQAWESGAVFNCGAVIADDGLIYLLYRAIPLGYTWDPDGKRYDNYVSSVGCASSEDGIHFTRSKNPVLQPLDEAGRVAWSTPIYLMEPSDL